MRNVIMFPEMTVSPSTLLSSNELQQLASDTVVPSSYRNSRETVEDALQAALTYAIDAKVEARISVILEGIGDAFYALDQEWRFSYINGAAERYFGKARQDMLGQVIWEVFPQSAGTELRRRFEEIAASGIAAAFESDAVALPGRWLEMHVFPYNGGLGVSFRDWTERRRAEEELRESQARLSALADNVPGCMVYQLSNAAAFYDRKLIYLSKSCEQLTGIPAEEAMANPALLYALVLPEYHASMFAKELECFHARKMFDIEIEMRHAKTGEIRWHRLTLTPRTLANGTLVWDGLQIDITEHKRSEEHLRLLVNELNHRVKNTLATVQSLAVQSFHRRGFQHHEDVVEARTAFEARLFALARGHDVLTRENWEGASLCEVANEAIAPYRSTAGDARRFEIDGHNLRVPPSMALSLSMALHELCTNALKYGALSLPGGKVLLSWSIDESVPEPRLKMAWEERGGPPVTPPTRTGFGSRLIQTGLARELNGTVRLIYEPTGVVCTIDVPLS